MMKVNQHIAFVSTAEFFNNIRQFATSECLICATPKMAIIQQVLHLDFRGRRERLQGIRFESCTQSLDFARTRLHCRSTDPVCKQTCYHCLRFRQ